MPSIAIVGYTNAGKSSLLNALTGAGVLVENALFATLEPTTRRGQFDDGRPFVLTDTVGFVRHLPTQLVEAFRSTLEEVVDADLLVHVVDGSDVNPLAQINAVRQVVNDVIADYDMASRHRNCWWSTRPTRPATWRSPSCAARCPMRCSSRRTPATDSTGCGGGWRELVEPTDRAVDVTIPTTAAIWSPACTPTDGWTPPSTRDAGTRIKARVPVALAAGLREFATF